MKDRRSPIAALVEEILPGDEEATRVVNGLVMRSRRATRTIDVNAYMWTFTEAFDEIRRLPHPWAKYVADRIATFNRMTASMSSIRIPSLRGFAYFLRSYPASLTMPECIVTDDGNIVARWATADNEYITLEFISENDIHCVYRLKKE